MIIPDSIKQGKSLAYSASHSGCVPSITSDGTEPMDLDPQPGVTTGSGNLFLMHQGLFSLCQLIITPM